MAKRKRNAIAATITRGSWAGWDSSTYSTAILPKDEGFCGKLHGETHYAFFAIRILSSAFAAVEASVASCAMSVSTSGAM